MKFKAKMNKLTAVVLLAALCLTAAFSLSGCVLLDAMNVFVDSVWGGEGIGQVRDRADALRLEYSETIIKGISEENPSVLKALFCDKSRCLPDIDGQLRGAFDFIEGNITGYTVAPEASGEGYGKNDGVIDLYEFCSFIYNVRTDAGKEYEISFHMYYVVRNKDRKGITDVTLRDTANTTDYDNHPEDYEDDTYYRIGYYWNENYIYDASCVAYTAIAAISGGDTAALADAFAARIAESVGFRAQAEAACGFFEGNATFGVTVNMNGEEYLDGSHDFRVTSVNDRVTLDGETEAVIYVEVMTVNIETDSGKVYEMEWAAYLKNADEPDSEGIMYLTLTDGEDSVTVGEKPVR